MADPAVMPPPHSRIADPVGLIAANITPVAGMLILRWPPADLVALYTLDTALALWSMAWLVMEHVTEAKSADRGVKRALKLGASSLLVAMLLGLVLIGPMAIMYADSEWVRQAPWRNASFQAALALQFAGSVYSLWRTHRMLDERDDDEPFLADQFRYLVARWIVVLGVVFLGIPGFLGETLGSALIVVVYAGASIWFGLFPDEARRMFFPNGKKDGAKPAEPERRPADPR